MANEPPVSPALAQAIALHRAGRLADVEAHYRSILAREPRQFDTLHLFGLLLHHLGRHEDAVASYSKVLAFAPDNRDVPMNMGAALAALGRHEEALAKFDT